MALTKDPNLEGSFYGGGAPSIQEMSNPPPLELFSYRVGHSSIMLPEGESSDSLGSYSSCSSLLPFLSDPSNSSSSTYSVLGHAGAGGMMGCSPPPYDRSGLSVFYRTAAASEPWGQSSATAASLLSFEHGGGENAHEDDCAAAWMDAMDPGYQLGATSDRKRRTDSRLIREQDCLEVESRGGSSPGMKDKRKGQEQFGLIDFPAGAGATAATADGGLQESGAGAGQPRESQKRKHTDAGDMPSPKKQTTKRIKESKSSPAKDPQSIAAKNRRERISERLKILQDLVPNGTKVDLVTMLEKAISYVKFLQLQVKVLATDEFWPAQGGKAPDIGQVKEAIDAILSSQRDRNSSSIH